MEMCYDGALVMPNNYVVMNEEEMTYLDGGGFVGFHVHLPKDVINMGSIIGAAYVGGVVAWHAKVLATTPWGAGAAAAITAAAIGIAGYAIKMRLTYINIGMKIPYISWSKHIYI